MKSFLALAALLLNFNFAFASSAAPCAPVIKAKPIIISCSEDGVYYGIRINVQMADRNICPAEDYVETYTAKITIGDFQGNIQQVIDLKNGEFNFEMKSLGEASFQSEKANLNLNNCAYPMHGGFSVGN